MNYSTFYRSRKDSNKDGFRVHSELYLEHMELGAKKYLNRDIKLKVVCECDIQKRV